MRGDVDSTVLGTHQVRGEDAGLLWLDTLVSARDAEHPEWEVVAEVKLTNRLPQSFVTSRYGVGHEKVMGQVFALVAPTEREFHETVFRAWRVDFDALQIMETDATTVVCINEGYLMV